MRPARLVTITSRPRLVTHALRIDGWQGPALRIAVLSDLHVAVPWTTLAAVRRMVRQTNRLAADLVVLAGDYLADGALPARPVPAPLIAEALSGLTAPLGVFAVLGNHDWYDCHLARQSGQLRNAMAEAFAASPIRLLRNDAVALRQAGREFWLVGFDSQRPGKHWGGGLHRPEAAFAAVPEGAPAILVAHEPDYFEAGDRRAHLQISGHTHAGQLNLFGWRPLVPSQYGDKYAHGHYQIDGRHLIVSAGLGFSGLPMRIGAAPEITLIDLGGNSI